MPGEFNVSFDVCIAQLSPRTQLLLHLDVVCVFLAQGSPRVFVEELLRRSQKRL
eukprot:jgi/Antlo1/1927/574